VRRVLLAALLPFAVACYQEDLPRCTISCAADADCPGDLVCSPGLVCSDPGNTCGFSCAANTYVRCAGDTAAAVCNATGTDVSEVACGDGGCITDASGPHCAHIVPEYAPAACEQPAPLELYESPPASTLMTSAAACTYTITQADVSLCVIRARTIALHGIQVYGEASLAFIADDALTIDGELVVAADGVLSGPGASLTTSGTAPDIDDGGGGAGYKEFGGAGGDSVTSFGLPILGREATFMGGRPAGGGGGGGGAVMLVSCHGTVTIRGVIDAGGGGGPGGHPPRIVAAASAGGGGSGGHILIQAVVFFV
jgi:hypothetical protein